MFEIFFGIIFIILALFVAIILISTPFFYMDTSQCTAFVNNKPVYSGYCRLLTLGSVGENGNTKVLKVSEGVLGYKTIKTYATENITVINN